MMEKAIAVVILLFTLLLLADPSLSLPLCTDSSAPFTLNKTLSFCGYNGSCCCNSTDDLQLQRQFQRLNVSDPGCASVLKSIICSRCDPFSSDLFTIKSSPRTVPLLCNSTNAANSSQSSPASNNFCSKVWDTCENVSILNSPFAPSLGGQAGLLTNSTITKLTDLWQSKTDFCGAFGGQSVDDSVCFNGEPVKLNNTEPLSPPNGLCLEKIGNGSYLDMVPHTDGSNRAFFASQPGKVWLATIPEEGSGGILQIDEYSPFIDLTDEVSFSSSFGMMGIAFHPNFAQNGRFFASFNCDKSKWPACGGRCACNSDVDCDPSKLPPDNGAQPCQYHSVIAEYTANSTGIEASKATEAKPMEVRRIFTMGLPFTAHHGGQILFGPTDGYLYFMMGDGGAPNNSGDPYNFSQNKKSLLGKIMRFDVDNIPSAEDINKLGLWGNYSIPRDNPFSEDTNLLPEIWALGFRNPWRCSFDSDRPSYFMCADVGQDIYEEVDIVTKGGNYGWRVYEGRYLYNPGSSPGGNTPPNSISPIFPVTGYNHSEVNKNEGSASITGGYFYRSQTDPCMYGRYLYADLYAGAMWAATETPENSGNFTSSRIQFGCAKDSPVQCITVPGSSLPSLGYIFSFGEDNKKDNYVLASSGVYRVVRPSRCGFTCSKESAVAGPSPSPISSPPSSQATRFVDQCSRVLIILSAFLVFLLGAL